MPSYGTLTLPPALYLGDSYLMWSAETPAVGAKSERVCMARVTDVPTPAYSIFCKFSGAPGVFQIDLQVADQDVESSYLTIQSINAVDATNQTCRFDVPQASTNQTMFARLVMTARANNVTVTATATR